MKKKCIIISGPTAVGKTALGIDVASYFNTSVISADSRQCFRELNIGVAKPNAEQLNKVHHYFINSHSIQDNINAADFEKYALSAVEELFQKSAVALMVGGTGLYIKAFQQGLDQIPQVPADIRKSIIQQFEQFGMDWLVNQIKNTDPEFYASGELQNPQRMMRALEVITFTGRSIRSFQTKNLVHRDFECINITVALPRSELYNRINTRVDEMVGEGLVDEVSQLIPYRQLNALQTVGYREIFDYLDQTTTLNEAIQKIKQNTRHYAKRQITWLSHQLPESIILPPESNVVIPFIESLLG